MAQDNDHGTLPEQQPSGVLNDPYTRRRFLRAAVVGTAGVAGAAGVAGVALASGHGPKLLGNPLVGDATLSTGCIKLKEGSKRNDPNHNHFLEILTTDASKVSVGECIILTAKSGNAGTFKTTITNIALKAGTTVHTLLCICPSLPITNSEDEWPEGSTICPSTDCPPQTNCASCNQ